MGKMYRIICSKLLVLVRLVIVVSLAGYSLSGANAAMHGAGSGGPSAVLSMDHGASEQMHDHHSNLAADHGDDGGKVAQPDCCADFCAGMAIIGSADSMSGPALAEIHVVIDDQGLRGRMPPLYRPPNI